MLKKLLRYDLQSVFKYWWIAALASFGISILGGGSIATLASEHNDSALLTAGAGIGVFIAIMGLCAFMLSSTILIFVRFYKNFFTDEGYLTFTLPVRRSQLIISKLIMSVLVNFSTALVFFIDIIFMLSIGIGSEVILEEIPAELAEFTKYLNFKVSLYILIYIIEFLFFVLLSSATATLFMFCCITFASIITKKAKVLTAIGIYYVATSIVSSITQFLYLFGIGAFSEWFAGLPDNMYAPIIAVIILLMISFVGLIGLLLYLLMHWMLDRKLNLA
ncbi:MAG: hypothetical protein E7521_04145 [Ruminococcaceae bacterium]|nr:hypothetical protein [Oscillospiraceae bacterium]